MSDSTGIPRRALSAANGLESRRLAQPSTIARRTSASGASSTRRTPPPLRTTPSSAHNLSRSGVKGRPFIRSYSSDSTGIPTASSPTANASWIRHWWSGARPRGSPGAGGSFADPGRGMRQATTSASCLTRSSTTGTGRHTVLHTGECSRAKASISSSSLSLQSAFISILIRISR